MRIHQIIFAPLLLVLQFFFFSGALTSADAWPVSFKDADNRSVTIGQEPGRVVSIVPAVTEILFAIGAGDAVCGVTYHDIYPPEANRKPVMGGFFAPSVSRIQSQNPGIIFISDLHREMIEVFKDKSVQLIRLQLDSLSDLYETILLLGRIFDEAENAAALAADIRKSLDHIAKKTAAIPKSEKKRVIRLMGRGAVMTPGDDSFQNELIRLAGGIAPNLGKKGKIVSVTKEEWKNFNPQIIYGCGGDRKLKERLLNEPGWKDVEAVKNGKILFFPCDMTCRLSSRTGYFVSCLASQVYGGHFGSHSPVIPDGITASRPVPVELPFIASAKIIDSSVYDFTHKTLLIHLTSPMSVSSTLEGFRQNISYVGNSYSPPQCWGLYHHIGLEASRKQLFDSIGREAKDTSMLFTGAVMDNLSVQEQTFKEMKVVALVTAGVKSNAMRMSQDTGMYYEPGTINMIILSNMKLSPRAMNRAVISATEAKTAALWDMDIRSSYTPMVNPATGTGTDNIIVVEGQGIKIDNAGGHSKMGELIGKAVYAGVQEAVFKQNGIVSKRNIFQRLKDRHITLSGLVGDCECGLKKDELSKGLERLLLELKYAGFIETAFAVSDHYERGLIEDISGFREWCGRVSDEIAGKPVEKNQDFGFSEPLPPVLEMAFEALLNGVVAKQG